MTARFSRNQIDNARARPRLQKIWHVFFVLSETSATLHAVGVLLHPSSPHVLVLENGEKAEMLRRNGERGALPSVRPTPRSQQRRPKKRRAPSYQSCRRWRRNPRQNSAAPAV